MPRGGRRARRPARRRPGPRGRRPPGRRFPPRPRIRRPARPPGRRGRRPARPARPSVGGPGRLRPAVSTGCAPERPHPVGCPPARGFRLVPRCGCRGNLGDPPAGPCEGPRSHHRGRARWARRTGFVRAEVVPRPAGSGPAGPEPRPAHAVLLRRPPMPPSCLLRAAPSRGTRAERPMSRFAQLREAPAVSSPQAPVAGAGRAHPGHDPSSWARSPRAPRWAAGAPRRPPSGSSGTRTGLR